MNARVLILQLILTRAELCERYKTLIMLGMFPNRTIINFSILLINYIALQFTTSQSYHADKSISKQLNTIIY